MSIHSYQAVLIAVFTIVGVTGCASGQRSEQAGSADQTEIRRQEAKSRENKKQGDQASTEGVSQGNQASSQGHVIGESTEVIRQEGGRFGEKSATTGQTTIPVQKRITRTVISENQIPIVRICEERADANRMDAQDFVALGFSQDVAQSIIRLRQQRGGFRSFAELAAVPGIDQTLLQELRPELVFARRQSQQAGMMDSRHHGHSELQKDQFQSE